ncbi:hypothetical protein [Paenibacillus sp. MABNR03]|uniref:hypothetical protein n=1 Tax=Paenibacillus sp. MABNR03 TaxID=3142626 RepID=UPI003D2DF7F2
MNMVEDRFNMDQGTSHGHVARRTARWFIIRLCISLLLVVSMGSIHAFTPAAEAAGPDLGVTAQKSWEALLKKADAQTKASLQQAYQKVGNWTTQEQSWEQKTKTLHAANAAELSRLRQEIRKADEAKLAALADTLKRTQTRYEPMFTLYTTVNKQLAAARAAKNKEWTAALRAQAEILKPAVQLAKADVRMKKQQLADARKRKSTEDKRLRSMLAAADPFKKQIQTGKKQASLTKERYANALKLFKQNIKQGQPSRVLSSLNQLSSAAEKWAGSQQNIHALEQKVADIYLKAKKELAKRTQ